MPAIQEQKATGAPMQQQSILQSPLQNEPSLETPPPPKAFKVTIPHVSRIRTETPNIPFPNVTHTPPMLRLLSPIPVVNKATILSSVPTLGELDPNDYHRSRAQAA